MTLSYRQLDDALQWTGAVAIICGHVLNTLGSQYHQDLWNIVAFAVGTVCFLAWAVRVANKPQMMVNIVAMTTCVVGLVKAWI
jgi:hypothetical protein